MLNYNNIIMFLIIISLLTLTHLVSASDSEVDAETPLFTYTEGTGNGPENWGKINPKWKLCSNGKLQSPIDIADQGIQVFNNLRDLKTYYKPAPAVVKKRCHEIQVKWKGYAGKININGTDYNLTQCHWHSPSEHTLNGNRFDLELHSVHVSSRGKTAIIAILYNFGYPDPLLSKLLPRMKSIEKEEKKMGIVNPGDMKLESRKYYRYIGSLTTPPCTEGVVWTVVEKVRTVSIEQVKALREAVHDGFEANTRPLQQSDGRPIWLYTPRYNY